MRQKNPSEDSGEEEGRGRSKRKREVQAFDSMALDLLKTKEETIPLLPITDALKEGLHNAITTTSKSAKRRHLRHLAGMLRDRPTEVAAIEAYLKGEKVVPIVGDEDYRDLNNFRDRLCDPKNFDLTLDEVCDALTYVDRMLIKSLATTYHRAQDEKSYRKLFKELRRAADEAEQDEA